MDTGSSASRPTGTVTFLFTDIEGSTNLLHEMGDRYAETLERHRDLLRGAFTVRSGHEVDTQGDSFFVAFERPSDALAAALDSQLALGSHDWGGHPVRVRMGLHTGDAADTPTGYVGLAVHQAQRISAAAHGGQVLISEATRHLLGPKDLSQNTELIDLGEHRFTDMAAPVRIYQLAHPELPKEFPPIRSLDARPHNLPIQLTSLVGRGDEIGNVSKMLEANRLVTLTGAAGCGKTRLALHAAAELVDSFPDGVWLAELAVASDPELVPRKVAEALGLPMESAGIDKEDRMTIDVLTRLQFYLKPKKLLLVLDNCEHLLLACATLAEALLRTCPDVKILATSREPLGMAGESAFRVPSLSIPDPKGAPEQDLATCESVQLFTERARLADPGFTLVDDNAEAVAQICSRLDGMPLAIELAAAKVRVLSPPQIAERLDEMFRLLTGGGKTALERQQTLRAAVDWSYRLLSEQERLLLQKLAVFSGGFDLEAAEEVCQGEGIDREDILDLLTHLVDASFVIRHAHRGASRYRLLETIRQYAREKLFESDMGPEVRTRHRDHYLGVGEHISREIQTGSLARALQLEEDESENLMAALDWSLTGGDAEGALRMCSSLADTWGWRFRWAEVFKWFEAALSLSEGEESSLRADVMGHASTMAAQLGEPGSRAMGEGAVALARKLGDLPALGRALANLGHFEALLGETEAAETALKEALSIVRETEQHWWTSKVLWYLGTLGFLRGHQESRSKAEEALVFARSQKKQNWVVYSLDLLGNVQYHQGDFRGAHSSFVELLALLEELDLEPHVVKILSILSQIAQKQGNPTEAKSLFEDALARARKLRDPRALWNTLGSLGNVASQLGNYEQARSLLEERLDILRDVGTPLRFTTSALVELGWVALLLADFEFARPLMEEALSSARKTNSKQLVATTLFGLGTLSRYEGKLGEARALLEESLAIARGMESKPLVAPPLARLGELAVMEGDHTGALDLHREALRLLRDLGARQGGWSLMALGSLAAAAGQSAGACRLLGAAEAVGESTGWVMPPVMIPAYEADLERLRGDLSPEEFAAEWAKGRAMSIEEAVEYALTADLISP